MAKFKMTLVLCINRFEDRLTINSGIPLAPSKIAVWQWTYTYAGSDEKSGKSEGDSFFLL